MKQQEYNRSTDVTVLPPSFNYQNENEFLAQFYFRKYKIKTAKVG
jgi:hypothetical protein